MVQKILIVEDNELNMKLFNDLLEAHGYATVTTHDGMQAFDLVTAERPDLILMDIQLPEISGLQITKQIKAEEDLKHIPIIAVTAFAMKGDEDRIRESGCQDYISKPISIAGFMETITKYMPAANDSNQKEED